MLGVIASSLVLKGASERVKADRRDAVRLALALRAGLASPVRDPSLEEEVVRDLVRARADLMALLADVGVGAGLAASWREQQPCATRVLSISARSHSTRPG